MGKRKDKKVVDQEKKNYSLAKEKDEAPSVDNPGDIKVKLSDGLEKDLLKLIHDHKKTLRGTVSGRITAKKLTDMYLSLQEAGFIHGQIEEAMSNTVTSGGDLLDALDWLCLFTPNEKLPEGFSQTILKEEEKRRPKFSEKQSAPPLAPTPSKLPVTVQQPTKGTSENENGGSKESGMKNWILQYADKESSSEDEDEGVIKMSDAEFDPDEKYLELVAKLLDAKNLASQAKQEGKKDVQKQTSLRIRELTQGIARIEVHPKFNPQVKIDTEEPATNNSTSETTVVKDAEGSTSKCDTSEAKVVEEESSADAEGGDGDMLGFSLFEEQAAAPVKEEKVVKKQPAQKKEIRHFEYTQKQWTGKSPKQFLNDWCRKNLPKNSKLPSFNRIQSGGNLFRCRVKIEKKKEENMEMCPEIWCENLREAEHLASTLALYSLCKGQRVYQLLPPPYRDIWLEWQDAENKEKEAASQETNKPREKFIAGLLKKLKADRSSEKSTVGGEAEEEDTWESLADDDFSEFDKESTQNTQPTHKNSMLKEIHLRNTKSSSYKDLLKTRQELPVFQHKEGIVAMVTRESVVVIAGETGSGKSTQVPQFILEQCLMSSVGDKCNIVVTEPRRISATSLATRVAQELGGGNPGTRNSLCGYQIRFESKKSANTRLTYCTTGVLLRKLQQDPDLKDVSHVIVDEVHERSLQSDFLLIILRQLLLKRPDFKVILMSATLDSHKFSSYFQHCRVINIPGRTFPVQVHHIEDVVQETGYTVEQGSPYSLRYEDLVQEESTSVTVTGQRGDSHKVNVNWTTEDASLLDTSNLDADKYTKKTRHTITRLNFDRINMELVVSLLIHLDKDPQYSKMEGAVLIFLPGLSHIQELYELVTSDRVLGDESRYSVIALHSVLSSQDQSQAFNIPKKGIRKIVIATNIAETGITIPDVVFVVDCGTVKETRYLESSQMSTLEEVFISKASAKQRQGRAGRVREGVCFRLYTKEMYTSFKSYSVPEILRVPLEELCLHIMKCELGDPSQFLAQALDPPQQQTITRAMNLLRDVGACEYETAVLKPLGHHLAALPVNVRIGKMLLFGAIFGCLEPVAVIAAAMTDKSPFVVPLGKRDSADAARQLLATANSDHITVYRAYLGWKAARGESSQAEYKYCQRYFLKRTSLFDIERVKDDLMKLVSSIGFDFSTKPTTQVAPTSSQRTPEVLDISKTVRKVKLEPSPPEVAMIKAVLTAGLYPHVAKTTYVKPVDAAANPTKSVCVAQTPQGTVSNHPSSVNRFLGANGYIVYHEKVKLSRVYLRDTTLISPYPILLFGGTIDVTHLERLVSVDGWIQFKAFAKTGVLFKELRILIEDLLQSKLQNPSLCVRDDPVVKAIVKLIIEESR